MALVDDKAFLRLGHLLTIEVINRSIDTVELCWGCLLAFVGNDAFDGGSTQDFLQTCQTVNLAITSLCRVA